MSSITIEDLAEIEDDNIRQLAKVIIEGNLHEPSESRYINEILNSSGEQLNQKAQHLTQSIKEKARKLQEVTEELQLMNISLHELDSPKTLKKMTLKELKQHCASLRSIMSNYIDSFNRQTTTI
ncbi:hypothetical protein OIY81_620 [Cryptosporidium canis]|uniref:Uncharacterized protein n=1 Tax=Cryptosporidium canis TaxID=195482 RepID=A0ABQ8P5B5_9CRYT|nr:hypothetical protein OJ252_3259 [Cryptosporidium canis]KAJ1614242.1 hypothetical protein OIY81_620 [Cryptosporidium canis]